MSAAPCTFYCQECGHHFRTVKAAEKAAFGDDGCPKCGGSDIDEGRPDRVVEHAAVNNPAE